ncbi:hypothetical protein [Williamsia soli]|uniref:hypothetical protein n=1 Tax=Williamsia soli TaxID=364929 RepID=UPI001A9D2C53|nr:hypothetical protein [Williamsia soli]
MKFSRQFSAVAVSLLAACAFTVSGAPAASAAPVGPTLTAAPVSVLQIPAIGVKVSGLVIPGPHLASVNAASAAPGKTTFSTSASPETCATTVGGSLVRINYVNVRTGDRGTSVVKPCPYFLDPAPTHQTVHTGSGPVAFTVSITGSWAYPNAGQPSLPGGGGFVAP